MTTAAEGDGGLWSSFRERVASEDTLGVIVADRRLLEALVDAEPELAATELRAYAKSMGAKRFSALWATATRLCGDQFEQLAKAAGLSSEELMSRWSGGTELRSIAGVTAAAAGRIEALVRFRHELDSVGSPSPPDPSTDVTRATLQRSAPIDRRLELALGHVAPGGASDAVIAELEEVRTAYRAQASSAGEGDAAFLTWKAANAGDWMGRAYDLLLRNSEAMDSYEDAAGDYDAAGDGRAAAECRVRLAKAAARERADIDTTLQRLLRAVGRFAGGQDSLAHAEVLGELVKLLIEVGDSYEADRLRKGALEELSRLGYKVPTMADLEVVVEGWVRAIPATPFGDVNGFVPTFMSLLTLHASLCGAGARLATSGDVDADEAEQMVARLGSLADQATAQVEQVMAELQSALGELDRSIFGQERPSPLPGGGDARGLLEAINALARAWQAFPGDAEPGSEGATRVEDLLAVAQQLETQARGLGIATVVAAVMVQRADILLAVGRAEEAAAVLEQAHAVLSARRSGEERAASLTVLSRLAEVQMSVGDSARLSATAGLAIAEIEADRYRISAAYLQSAYLRDRGALYRYGVGSAYLLGDHETMLARAELSKAHATLGWLSDPQPPTPGEADIDGQLREVSAEIDRARAGQAPPAERDLLLEKRRRLWDLLAIERAKGGDCRPVEPDGLVLAQLQAAVAADEAVVYYYWLAPAVLLVVTIDTTRIVVERKILDSDHSTRLHRNVQSLAALIGSARAVDRVVASHADILLPSAGREVLEGKRRLIFSPHQILHQFPLHALPWDGGPVFQHFAVRYAPNLTSLLLVRPGRASPRVVAVGVESVNVPGVNMGLLTGARAEIAAVAAVYTDRGIHVDTLVGPDATKDRLDQWASDGTLSAASCLHLSTHGVNVSTDTPLESRLYLTDGVLDGLDIARWRLRANLVVLMACFSGQRAIGGRSMDEVPGDELFGLQAALYQAGASGVIGSMWAADEQAAIQVASSLHGHLARGTPPDLALQAAQCEYLAGANMANRGMYYWAPFFLSTIGRTPTSAPSDAIPTTSSGG